MYESRNAILDFGSDDEDNEADYGEGISSAFSEQKPKKKRSKVNRKKPYKVLVPICLLCHFAAVKERP